MTRELLKRLHKYFAGMENPTEDEKSMLKELTERLPFFHITALHRDDLRERGFDTKSVSDATMERIARKMAEDYCAQLFHESLDTIAELAGVPKSTETRCPMCEGNMLSFDLDSGKNVCQACGAQWSDNYVLIQFPENASHFEDNDIGYPCFDSDDNGARYVPERDYVGHFKKAPASENLFKPLCWPESQAYLECPDERCEAILSDEKSLEDFGPSAVWVPVSQ